MTNQVTRREITAQWTEAQNRANRDSYPSNFNSEQENVVLPLLNYINSNRDNYSPPSSGYLIKREGYSDIVLVYDDGISDIASDVARGLEYILDNAESLGIDSAIIGPGYNSDEAIIIYMNESIGDGSYQGAYLNLDNDLSQDPTLADRFVDGVQSLFGITVTVAITPNYPFPF